jgi:hypothetical protein
MKRLALITFLLLGFLGETTYSQAADQHAPKVLSSSLGRYVFGQVSDFRVDRFMLDTQTGRLWVASCAPLPGSSTPLSELGSFCSNGMQVLEPVPYDNGVKGFSFLP